MKKQIPEFPQVFNGFDVVWGRGSNAVGLQVLLSIPHFKLMEEGPERDKKEKEYWESKQVEYDKAKKLYESSVSFDFLYYGSQKEVSMRISKISTNDNGQMVVNLCASKAHKLQCKIDGYKPVKSQKWTIETFLSLISNESLKIIKLSKIAA